MKINKELKKIELLCTYANTLVEELGQKDQIEKSKLYDIDKNEYFKRLLYVNNVFPSFNGNNGVSFDIRDLLFKRICGCGENTHFITLLDPCHGDSFESDFWCYSSKKDMDECESLQKLKRIARAMIKNPQDYFKSK